MWLRLKWFGRKLQNPKIEEWRHITWRCHESETKDKSPKRKGEDPLICKVDPWPWALFQIRLPLFSRISTSFSYLILLLPIKLWTRKLGWWQWRLFEPPNKEFNYNCNFCLVWLKARLKEKLLHGHSIVKVMEPFN